MVIRNKWTLYYFESYWIIWHILLCFSTIKKLIDWMIFFVKNTRIFYLQCALLRLSISDTQIFFQKADCWKFMLIWIFMTYLRTDSQGCIEPFCQPKTWTARSHKTALIHQWKGLKWSKKWGIQPQISWRPNRQHQIYLGLWDIKYTHSNS